jgi:Tfp pilus assembly protein PilN
MIQLNLLPDSRVKELKSGKIAKLIITVSSLVSLLVIIITVLLFVEVKVVQKNNINSYNSQISVKDKTLNQVPDLNSILKINDAIQILPSLYTSRPDVTRLPGYLALITPANVSITSMTLDFKANSVNINGTADSINTINTFVDTLKFCEFSVNSGTQSLAFSNVDLSNYSFVPGSTTGQTFTVIADFNPIIFAAKDTSVKLIVPNKITTRSDVDQPANLFNAGGS